MLHGDPTSRQRRVSILISLISFAFTAALPAHAAWLELAGGRSGSQPVLTYKQLSDRILEVVVTVPGMDLRQTAIEGAAYSLVTVPGCAPLIEAGYPELPLLTRALPVAGEGTQRLELLETTWQRVNAAPPLPSRGPLSRADDRPAAALTFADVYTRGEVWPSAAGDLGPPFLVRDRRGVTLRVHPARWDAGAQQLEALVSMRLRIVTEGTGGRNTTTAPPRPAGRSFAPLMRAIFPESAAGDKQLEATDGSTAAAAGERLLIITAPALRAAVADLVTWKQERGYTVEVLDMTELGGDAQGIRAAVQERYAEEASLAHLLLVGDATLVPTNAGTYQGAASDGMYGLVAGDDLFVDVLVCRLPARDPAELSLMIARTVAYERDPQPDGVWFSMAAGIASDEGVPADYQRADLLRDSLLAGDFTKVASIYQSQGGSRSQIAAAINGGVSLVNYLGHGSGVGWQSVPFDSNDVRQLVNTTAWPWIIDVACHNGDFLREECFAEAWLRANRQGQPTGAVAVLAASSATSWVSPCLMQETIIKHLVDGGQAELGALFAAGVAAVLIQYEGTDEGRKLMEQYNLFGDGSLQVRSRQPRPLIVAHPTFLEAGRPTLTLELPAQARAVLSAGDGVLARGEQTGAQPLLLTPARDLVLGESLRLTVTATNALPYRVTLIVGSEADAAEELPPLLARSLDSWPNPFNPQTTVGFVLADAGSVQLAVHDARGRLVKVLLADHLAPGSHQVVWDGRDAEGREVASGVYLALLRTDQGEQIRKMMLTR